MIQLLMFLGVGLGFLILLFVFARRASSVEGSAQALVETRNALQALQHGLLPPEFVERIFAEQDLHYVASSAPGHVQDAFLRDRKRIASGWVSQVRSQVLSLKEYHLRRSRFYSQLSVATEISLAVTFTILLLQCRVLQLLLVLGGPYSVPRMVDRTAAAASRICTISEKSLAFLTPSRTEGFGEHSTGSGAPV